MIPQRWALGMLAGLVLFAAGAVGAQAVEVHEQALWGEDVQAASSAPPRSTFLTSGVPLGRKRPALRLPA